MIEIELKVGAKCCISPDTVTCYEIVRVNLGSLKIKSPNGGEDILIDGTTVDLRPLNDSTTYVGIRKDQLISCS